MTDGPGHTLDEARSSKRSGTIRILFATDGSAAADVALEMLCDMPHRRETDTVTVLTVVPLRPAALGGDGGISPLVEETAAAEIADLAARHLGARGIHADVHVGAGSPARAILTTAVATRSELIVLGSRGRGLIAGAILGSTARSLARSSPLPVLVVRERRHAPRRVLAAVDGSPDSRAAIATLAVLPLPRDTNVVLMHVLPDARVDLTRAQDLLHVAACQLPPLWTTHIVVERGDVADRILERARGLGADLIVLGSRGTGIGEGFLQGTTADKVLSGAHCAVLIGRAAERVKKEEPLPRPLAQHAV
ncbi:MAG: universal stress protein [Chloroflexota bacterium]|nr:universal stress protein [Chloroflexota bacterium]